MRLDWQPCITSRCKCGSCSLALRQRTCQPRAGCETRCEDVRLRELADAAWPALLPAQNFWLPPPNAHSRAQDSRSAAGRLIPVPGARVEQHVTSIKGEFFRLCNARPVLLAQAYPIGGPCSWRPPASHASQGRIFEDPGQSHVVLLDLVCQLRRRVVPAGRPGLPPQFRLLSVCRAKALAIGPSGLPTPGCPAVRGALSGLVGGTCRFASPGLTTSD